jgi:hypothetical protein
MSRLKTKQVEVIETTDGKTWTDATAARTHQAALDYSALMDAYEKENPSLFVNQGSSGRARTALMPFLGWLESKGVEFPEFDAEPEAKEDA